MLCYFSASGIQCSVRAVMQKISENVCVHSEKELPSSGAENIRKGACFQTGVSDLRIKARYNKLSRKANMNISKSVCIYERLFLRFKVVQVCDPEGRLQMHLCQGEPENCRGFKGYGTRD